MPGYRTDTVNKVAIVLILLISIASLYERETVAKESAMHDGSCGKWRRASAFRFNFPASFVLPRFSSSGLGTTSCNDDNVTSTRPHVHIEHFLCHSWSLRLTRPELNDLQSNPF